VNKAYSSCSSSLSLCVSSAPRRTGGGADNVIGGAEEVRVGGGVHTGKESKYSIRSASCALSPIETGRASIGHGEKTDSDLARPPGGDPVGCRRLRNSAWADSGARPVRSFQVPAEVGQAPPPRAEFFRVGEAANIFPIHRPQRAESESLGNAGGPEP
jgi:hypothetical protein